MKHARMGLLLWLVAGLAQAGPLEPERAPQVTTQQTREAAPPRQVRPQTSPVRKAEATRRIFWLVMCLR